MNDENIWHPEKYDANAVIATESAQEMMLRLSYMTLKPTCIVDVGTGTGIMATLLKQRYRFAAVHGVDNDQAMLQQAASHGIECHLADANQLPFATSSVSMITANLLLPWVRDLNAAFTEWSRALEPNGLLLFSAFGPDTLRELDDLKSGSSKPYCIDMHTIGDLLLACGFIDPVLDVLYYTLTYDSKAKLLEELHANAMLLEISEIPESVALHQEDGRIHLTFEVVQAHAWKPEAGFTADKDGVAKIPLASLRRQLHQ